MKNLKKTVLLAAAAVAVAGLSFAGATAYADDYGETADGKDIVATAKEAGQFNTLASALQAAGLVETLQGDGPYTVFAPTDAAFEKLPSGTLDELLKPENKEQLATILKYHVVDGENMAADITGMTEVETLEGEAITISEEMGNVMLNNGVQVTQTDIKASNGVIHVIDGVLIPEGGN